MEAGCFSSVHGWGFAFRGLMLPQRPLGSPDLELEDQSALRRWRKSELRRYRWVGGCTRETISLGGLKDIFCSLRCESANRSQI